MDNLPDCNDCGNDEWQKFYEYEPERDDNNQRSEERYYCKDCEKEGSVFSGPGTVQLTGAFR